MRHDKTNIITDLLRATHARRETPQLSHAWRNAVMDEIGRTGRSGVVDSEWQLLAPRLSYVAAALSVVAAITAGQTLETLSAMLSQAYVNQLFNVFPSAFYSL